jgi:hypothetical protein
MTLASGKTFKFSPHLERAVGKENTIEQSADHAKDAERIAILAGIESLADRNWKSAGIGAG